MGVSQEPVVSHPQMKLLNAAPFVILKRGVYCCVYRIYRVCCILSCGVVWCRMVSRGVMLLHVITVVTVTVSRI